MIFEAAVLAMVFARAKPSASCDVKRMLMQVRDATYGDRWNSVAEIVADGVIDDAGSHGSFRLARDVKTGRGRFTESLEAGRVAYVYDGATKWEVDQGGGVHALDAPASITRTITESFIDSSAFWSDDHDAVACSGTQHNGSAAFDVLRLSPLHGSSVDLWVDRSTHLIDRKVERLPTTALTEQYADYRRTNGVMMPYQVTRRYDDQSGTPTQTVETISVYHVLSKAPAADFRRPPDPPPGHIKGPSTSVQIELDRGVTIFDAMVDGKGPFAFTFDPGAQGVLTNVAAAPLGLRTGRMVRIRSIQVGASTIDDIEMPVYAGAQTNLFPQRTPGRAPIGGSLGPELLDRFAVRLDDAAKTMTLGPPGTLKCQGSVETFVLQEDDDIPLMHANVDGHDGLFEFDVRAPASLILFKPFVDRIGLPRSAAVRSLSLGSIALNDVPTRFLSAVRGKFASVTEAGLLGSRLLSRFVTTIDYHNRTICLEPHGRP